MMAAGIMLAAYGGLRWVHGVRENTGIAGLQAGRSIPVSSAASVQLMAARGRWLIGRGDLTGAQAIADQLANTPLVRVRSALLYDLGNAHMRQAYGMMTKLPFWKVKPIVALAKSEFRQAVQLDLSNWDARYDYAIASSLVRDTEPAKPTVGDAMSHERAAWPDIPGAPNGMP
jgi:mxaK protein